MSFGSNIEESLDLENGTLGTLARVISIRGSCEVPRAGLSRGLAFGLYCQETAQSWIHCGHFQELRKDFFGLYFTSVSYRGNCLPRPPIFILLDFKELLYEASQAMKRSFVHFLWQSI